MAFRLSIDCSSSVTPAFFSDRPLSSLQTSRLSFFGTSQILLPTFTSSKPSPFPHSCPPKLPLITSVIKRRKDYPLDSVIERQKKLKIVSKIKDLLVKQPDMVMSLKSLGKYRKQLGLKGKRRCIALLKKYPAVFEIFEEGISAIYFRLTQEAEDQFMEEQKVRDELETVLVMKLRKMLMMSVDKRLRLDKVAHLKRDLGLSDDFQTVFVDKYPQYFKVVQTEAGAALELTYWDPELAISAAEKRMREKEQKSETEESDTISGRPRRFPKSVSLPRGYRLKTKDLDGLRKFEDQPYVSPYTDVSNISPSSREAEKHSCAVVHEILTFTLEKRTLIDHLTHFRRDYKFSQRIHSMLVRHPELFYVSFKGDRDCVFLREAYRGAELIEKDPLVLVKERLGELVSVGKNYRINEDQEEDEDDDDEDDFEDEEGDDWSDDEDRDGAMSTLNHSDGEKLDAGKRASRKTEAPSQGPAPVRRESRRPLHFIEREKALATQTRAPKEKW